MRADETWREPGDEPAGDWGEERLTARPRSRATHVRETQVRQRVAVQPGMGDILRLLLRELWLIVIVFCLIFGIGVVAALSMPASYTANASLLMQLSQNYVYDPATGDAARGAIATIDQVVQSEVEILNSTELKKRVIAKLGYKTILPDSPQYWNPATDAQKAAADQAALKVLQSGLTTSTAPQNNIVHLSFKHSDAMSAALILNTLIDDYQVYRRTVFTDTTGPLLEKQKQDFDAQLAVADQALQSFLAAHGVGDFQAAKATYASVYDTVTKSLYDAQSQLATDRAKLDEINANLKSLSPEMSTERDLDLSVPNKLFALKQQRQELLSRYLPNAQPVKDIDAQIAAYQAMLNSGNGIGEQAHKLGVNPIYQDAMTQKLNLEADIASLQGRIAQLRDQAAQATQKMQALLGIEAQYNNLSSDRDALQNNIKTFTQRIQENDAQQALAKEGSDDTVRVVEKAYMPDKPKSLKRVILILAFLFAGFTALCAGLLRVYTRKGFVSADMASRTLELPVLAEAGVKTA
jgi:uncharacterized protein involved in exopolysaccharide biosynthesis